MAKKELHDSIIDLVKRKRFSTEPEREKPVEEKAAHINKVAMEEELSDSHYMKPHWARATMETPVRIGDVKESAVELIDHGSKINLMSMDFTRKVSGQSTQSMGGRYIVVKISGNNEKIKYKGYANDLHMHMTKGV